MLRLKPNKHFIPKASIAQSLTAHSHRDGKDLAIHLVKKLTENLVFEELLQLESVAIKYRTEFRSFEKELFELLEKETKGRVIELHGEFFLLEMDIEREVHLQLRKDFLKKEIEKQRKALSKASADREKNYKSKYNIFERLFSKNAKVALSLDREIKQKKETINLYEQGDWWKAADCCWFPGSGSKSIYNISPDVEFISNLEDRCGSLLLKSVGNRLGELLQKYAELGLQPNGWKRNIFNFCVNKGSLRHWLEKNDYPYKKLHKYGYDFSRYDMPETRSIKFLDLSLAVEEPLYLFRAKHSTTSIRELEKQVDRARKREQQRSLRARAAQTSSEQRDLAKPLRDKRQFNRQRKIVPCCPYCEGVLGDFSGEDCAELDHIYPVSKGGLSVLGNTVFVCKNCNRLKGNKTLRHFAGERGYSLEQIFLHLDRLGKDS
jgi:5-methylcytosine-specific restriction endonuclease McrA